MLKITPITLVILLFLNCSLFAGPFTDNLSRCLVRSTSDGDIKKLVNWIFRVVTDHPHIKNNVGSVYSPTQKTKADVHAAEIFTTLLTETCREEAREALKYEKEIALFKSFETLGQVAMSKMMSDRNVMQSSQDLRNIWTLINFNNSLIKITE